MTKHRYNHSFYDSMGNSKDIITLPAPKDKTTSPAPGSAGSEQAETALRKVFSQRPRGFTQIAVQAIHSLLVPETQQQFLDEAVNVLCEYLLGDMSQNLKTNPAENIQHTREQIKSCIESGTLLPGTKDILMHDFENYFNSEERRLMREEEQSALELRKLSRDLRMQCNLLMGKCLQALTPDTLNDLTTHIYIELPKPTPESLDAPGVDIVFKKYLAEFFRDTLATRDLIDLLALVIVKYPLVFGKQNRADIINGVFSVLAEHTWHIISGK